jgi:hypothetical protein
LATTPAIRTRLEPGDPAERLAFALVEAHLRRAGVKVGATSRAIRARIERARDELRQSPEGAEEARHVTSGLTANGGALLRTVERAAPDTRDFATRAAVRFVALVREHGCTSTAAVVSLASSAQWSALAELLRDEAFAVGPAGESFGERLKQAAAASQAARLDLLGGLQVEREAREARPAPLFPWLAPAGQPRAEVRPPEVTGDAKASPVATSTEDEGDGEDGDDPDQDGEPGDQDDQDDAEPSTEIDFSHEPVEPVEGPAARRPDGFAATPDLVWVKGPLGSMIAVPGGVLPQASPGPEARREMRKRGVVWSDDARDFVPMTKERNGKGDGDHG